MNFQLKKVPADLKPALKILAKRYPALAGGDGAVPLSFEKLADAAAPASVADAGAGRTIRYARACDALRLLGRLIAGEHPAAPERIPFDRFGAMIDLSRNAVFTVDYAKAWLERLAILGYDYAMLYTEDVYELPDEPYFGMLRGRLTAADVRAIDDHAAALGIELVPCIETLGHLEQLFRWKAYEPLRDIDGILLAWEDKSYDLIEKMLRFWHENVRSKTINLGLDEAWRLGQGEFKKRFGEKKVFDIMLKHVERVSDMCRKIGVEAEMWSDMWFRAASKTNDYYDLGAKCPPKLAAQIPDNVRLCYWDYYHKDPSFYEKMIAIHRSMHGEPVMASGVWTWGTFWYNHRYTRAAAGACVDACRKAGLRDVIFTMWGDDGGFCDFESAFAGLAWAAERACTGKKPDEKVLENRYAALFAGASWKAVTALGEWTDGEATEILWDDPIMNLRAGVRRIEADWEVMISDTHAKHGDLEAGLRKAQRVLAKAHSDDAGTGGSMPYARALCAALLARIELANAIFAAWSGPKGRRRAAVRDRVLPAAGRNARAIETFAAAFRTMWRMHNRPQGMETTQIRLAGALERAHEAVLRFEEYAVGEVDTIPELDDLAKIGFKPELAGGRSWARLAHATVIA